MSAKLNDTGCTDVPEAASRGLSFRIIVAMKPDLFSEKLLSARRRGVSTLTVTKLSSPDLCNSLLRRSDVAKPCRRESAKTPAKLSRDSFRHLVTNAIHKLLVRPSQSQG